MRRRALSNLGLAKELGGIAHTTVARWRSGAVPRGDVTRQLADYFGVSVEALTDDALELPPDPVALRFGEAKAAAARVPQDQPQLAQAVFNTHLERSGHAAFLRLTAQKLHAQASELEAAANAIDPLAKGEWLERAMEHPDPVAPVREAVEAEYRRAHGKPKGIEQ